MKIKLKLYYNLSITIYGKMTYKHFNDKKINIYLGVELYFHIFITQYNYSHALKKNNIANV